ncbi:MAG: 1-acyl-sn-glycerol-3-phosphate acyltransferase [Bacteroidales bacterium]|nr:1-acyl-sn-glycerol-3-phosphate acyltransferase [Bacteroidales bacterium]
MALLSLEDARKLAPVFNGKGGAILYKALCRITSLDALSKVYEDNSMHEGKEFATHTLQYLKTDYQIGNYDRLLHLPEGPFITIANHPYGGVDGLILVDMFGTFRSDYKVMVNKLLGHLKAFSPSFITVTPTGNEKSAPTRESLQGVRLSMQHVRDGHPLGIFPSGAVSDLSLKEMSIRDRQWQESVVKIIKKLRVPIVPVRFFDRNSLYYYALGLIDWKVRLTRLCREGINKGGKRVRVAIGEILDVEAQDRIADIGEFTAFLRESVYGMPLPDKFVKRSEI